MPLSSANTSSDAWKLSASTPVSGPEMVQAPRTTLLAAAVRPGIVAVVALCAAHGDQRERCGLTGASAVADCGCWSSVPPDSWHVTARTCAEPMQAVTGCQAAGGADVPRTTRCVGSSTCWRSRRPEGLRAPAAPSRPSGRRARLTEVSSTTSAKFVVVEADDRVARARRGRAPRRHEAPVHLVAHGEDRRRRLGQCQQPVGGRDGGLHREVGRALELGPVGDAGRSEGRPVAGAGPTARGTTPCATAGSPPGRWTGDRATAGARWQPSPPPCCR